MRLSLASAGAPPNILPPASITSPATAGAAPPPVTGNGPLPAELEPASAHPESHPPPHTNGDPNSSQLVHTLIYHSATQALAPFRLLFEQAWLEAVTNVQCEMGRIISQFDDRSRGLECDVNRLRGERDKAREERDKVREEINKMREDLMRMGERCNLYKEERNKLKDELAHCEGIIKNLSTDKLEKEAMRQEIFRLQNPLKESRIAASNCTPESVDNSPTIIRRLTEQSCDDVEKSFRVGKPGAEAREKQPSVLPQEEPSNREAHDQFHLEMERMKEQMKEQMQREIQIQMKDMLEKDIRKGEVRLAYSHKGEETGENLEAPSNPGPSANPILTFGLAEPVDPLPVIDNAWKPKHSTAQDANSPEMIVRKVRGLLNKLTMKKFDSISDQIIQWVNKSKRKKAGPMLLQVSRLVFKNVKSADEGSWIEMHARLCRKMMERISPLVQDVGIKNAEGKPLTSEQLFRKYLLSRCQDEFERASVNKAAKAATAASKVAQDEAVKQAHEKQSTYEAILYHDEYHAGQKAKMQRLAVIKFTGELFKLKMLTERIMHDCVKNFLGNVDNPEEEEIECLCMLLTTVGQSLDTIKARAHMDVYFSRMKELAKSRYVSPRMQFMLRDVIELRGRKWGSRQVVAPPSTIAQIHENLAKEKSATEKDAFTPQISMSQGGSRRDRGDHPQVGPDGWAVAGSGPSRAPFKVGGLSNFGEINKSAPMTVINAFVGKDKKGKRDSISRTNRSPNMFSMIQAAEAAQSAQKAPTPQRKRLILQSRTILTESETPVPKSPFESSASGDADLEVEEDTGGMSEEAVETKIKEEIKDFFAIRSIEEAEVCWTALPTAHHHRLIDKLVSQAVESKDADAQLVADLFKSVIRKELCSSDAFERGFVNIANMIEDIAIDAPKAVTFFGRIVKAVELTERRRRRLADKASEGHEDEGKEEYAERIFKAIS